MEGGRYHLGEEIAFGIVAKNSTGLPVEPDAAPTFSVYAANGTKIISDKKFPPIDRTAVAGIFGYAQFLGMTFAAGQYLLYVKWVKSGFNGRYIEKFEVMPGGDAGGNVIAMTEFKKPHNTYIVRQLTSGIISAGRNPRLT